MFAVVFEFQPWPAKREDYLAVARLLRPELERIEGFLENERFESLAQPGRLLSLSIWRDEAALVRWRRHAPHRRAQARGRAEIFGGYRIRVGEVMEPPYPLGPEEAADRLVGVSLLEPKEGRTAATAVNELALPPAERATAETFASIYTEGRLAVLTAWSSPDAARAWLARPQPNVRHLLIRVVRDYGLHDRREAPQQFPPVGREPDPAI